MSMTDDEIIKNLRSVKGSENEVRFYSPANKEDKAISILESRSGEKAPDDDKYFHVKGTACSINVRYVLYPKGFMGLSEDYYEQVDPGAFDGCDMSDVVLNVNHGDGNHAVARTRNQTLSLKATKDGLFIDDAKLNKTNPRCVQFYDDVSEGLLDRMSFRFHVDKESFDEKENCFHIEKIAYVRDVSAVEFPANGETSISQSRSVKLESIIESRAEALREKEMVDEAKAILSKVLAAGGPSD